jgi:integrase
MKNTSLTAQKISEILRTNSVSTPSAVLTTLTQNRTTYTLKKIFPLSYAHPAYNVGGQIGAVILLQEITGCRISEILLLRTNDILLPDTLIIHGLKRSRSRSVRVPELAQQFSVAVKYPGHFLFSISYDQVRRWYLRLGIYSQFTSQSRKAVTHSLRYRYINAVSAKSDVETTQDIIGHKSQSSTDHYLQKGGTQNG